VDGPEPPHVGDDPVEDLGAAKHRVPLPLGREGAALLGGPADRGGQVLVRRGQHDALRRLVDDVPEVLRRGGSGSVVETELAVQRWWRRALGGRRHGWQLPQIWLNDLSDHPRL
jgi:hypothetical protein